MPEFLLHHKDEAELAVWRAEEIHKETVLELVLDGLILSQDI
jgi:hypothetical protein